MSRTFTKPAKTLSEQVDLLEQRGMLFADKAQAEFYLGQINYYRLGAYWLPFEADHATHAFNPGTTFEAVLSHYIFDRELRILLMDAIERIEIAVRTRWAYEMAHQHGPHSHMDSNLARHFASWVENVGSLYREVKRSDESFIAHYKTEYSQPDLPPVWAICEVMSLGLLSRCYTHLGPMATRRAIANHFELDQQQFEGLLEHLTYLRNLCAHHSRVWNRRFTKTMPLPRSKPKGLYAQLNPQADRKLYNSLVILLHLMDVIAPHHHWRQHLIQLLNKYPVNITDIGFPSGWQQLQIWQ